MALFYLFLGFALLVIGGEFLVRSSVGLSFKLNVSKLVIGMTVVSFATSAPELIVSVQAAFNGHPDLALGNVIGSNITNISLILGVTVMILPIVVDEHFYKHNWPMMMLMSILLWIFLLINNDLNRLEGLILLVLLIVFLIILVNLSRKDRELYAEDIDESLRETTTVKIFLWLIIGGVSLWYGSELLVKSATTLAKSMGVSERVIGISMVALGTSIPELAASLIAALRQEKAISLGNLIGSNIFNIGAVLGITSLIKPIPVNDLKLIHNDIYWMLGVAVALIPMAIWSKKHLLSRWEGLILMAAYITFIYLSFLGN